MESRSHRGQEDRSSISPRSLLFNAPSLAEISMSANGPEVSLAYSRRSCLMRSPFAESSISVASLRFRVSWRLALVTQAVVCLR